MSIEELTPILQWDKMRYYLQILDESLEEGNKVLSSPDISWHGFLEEIRRKGYNIINMRWLKNMHPRLSLPGFAMKASS